MAGDYSQVTEPTTAIRASLRDLLQAQITALELTPKWMWEIEFSLHVWPILERFHREGDPLAEVLVVLIKGTYSVSGGVNIIKQHLPVTTTNEAPPW